ncbi:MAG: sugar phosphate isomerase/epimerase family protein, partial [Candidatus Latescibacterota bacterium]
MRVGFISHTLDQDVLQFGVDNGFAALELAAGDAPAECSAQMALITRYREELGFPVLALGTAVNPLSADATQAAEAQQALRDLIDLCPRIGARYVSNVSGYNGTCSIEDNLSLLVKVYRPLLEQAKDAGVTIVFENCPHGFPFPGGMNMAATPELWEKILSALDEENFGLEYDPSHLVWQGVDYLAAARKFASRIVLMHAKDTEILHDRLGHVGMYGDGWWRYRLPGYGVIDWPKLFQIMSEAGFDGDLFIEHE